jgi:hypothetical protein
MAVDLTHTGKKFGHLVVAYSVQERPRDIACRCCCGKLVHVAVADLVSGTVTSCGCMPASQEYHERRVELRAQQRREITFNIAMMRRGT